MPDHRSYAREEWEPEEFRDVFDAPNEPLLGIKSEIEPGARGSVIAVLWPEIGPVNMPSHVAYPGHARHDAFGGPWYYRDETTMTWRICP